MFYLGVILTQIVHTLAQVTGTTLICGLIPDLLGL